MIVDHFISDREIEALRKDERYIELKAMADEIFLYRQLANETLEEFSKGEVKPQNTLRETVAAFVDLTSMVRN